MAASLESLIIWRFTWRFSSADCVPRISSRDFTSTAGLIQAARSSTGVASRSDTVRKSTLPGDSKVSAPSTLISGSVARADPGLSV